MAREPNTCTSMCRHILVYDWNIVDADFKEQLNQTSMSVCQPQLVPWIASTIVTLVMRRLHSDTMKYRSTQAKGSDLDLILSGIFSQLLAVVSYLCPEESMIPAANRYTCPAGDNQRKHSIDARGHMLPVVWIPRSAKPATDLGCPPVAPLTDRWPARCVPPPT